MVEIVSNPSRFFISQPMDSDFRRNDEQNSKCQQNLILAILILTFPRGKLGMRETQLRLKRSAGTGSSTPWSGNGQAGWVEPWLVSKGPRCCGCGGRMGP